MNPIIKGRLYWANKRFQKPGLYLWTGKRNLRLFPKIEFVEG